MDRKPLVPLAFVAFAGLLFVLSQITPRASLPLFERLRFGGNPGAPRLGGPEVRAGAQVPIPRRYVEACRGEAARRMARQDWAGLTRQDREGALTQVLILCGADAEYWTLPEARQKRVAREFAAAFLDAAAGGSPKGLVDK